MGIIRDILVFFGQTTIIISAIVFIFKNYTKDAISQVFKKGLENYKHELELYTEEKKFEYQRKLHNFTLYRSEIHNS